MNRKRIKAMRDDLALDWRGSGFRFDMQYELLELFEDSEPIGSYIVVCDLIASKARECGAVCCLSGLAQILFADDTRIDISGCGERALVYLLEISHADAVWMYGGWWSAKRYAATQADAVRYLEKVLEIGKIRVKID